MAELTFSNSDEARDALVRGLENPNRRRRQESAHLISQVADSNPDLVLSMLDQIKEALFRNEAQTRWECLDALTKVAQDHPDEVADAYDGAENSLFDEGSAAVRLSAFRFLAIYGSTSPEASDKVWPLLDEAIQCYHGDPEYRNMLMALVTFAEGDISDASREALSDRMAFDAKSGHGYIRSFSNDIIKANEDTAKAKTEGE